jgi:hypothetical protein
MRPIGMADQEWNCNCGKRFFTQAGFDRHVEKHMEAKK